MTTRRPRATATSRPMSCLGGDSVNVEGEDATMLVGNEDTVMWTSELISIDGVMDRVEGVLGWSTKVVLESERVARLRTWQHVVCV
jgi:hypothetical protein